MFECVMEQGILLQGKFTAAAQLYTGGLADSVGNPAWTLWERVCKNTPKHPHEQLLSTLTHSWGSETGRNPGHLASPVCVS